MRTLTSLLLPLAFVASGAAAEEFKSIQAGLTFSNGDIKRDTTLSTFDQDFSGFAHAEYETGAATLYGGFDFQSTDYTANGAASNNKDDTLYIDLGGEYSFGDFGIGGQLAYANFEGPVTDIDLTVVTVYGKYKTGGLDIGLGIFHSEYREAGIPDIDDEGFLIFGSYDVGDGLSFGAQVESQTDFDQAQLYANYDFEAGHVGFALIDTNGDVSNSQYIAVEGRYEIFQDISVIADVISVETDDDDSATEYALGVQYEFGNNIAAQLQYVKYDAFDSFSGDGIRFGVTYDLGKKRRSGYQPIARTFATKNSPVFFSF